MPQEPAAQFANQQPLVEGVLVPRYRTDFSGGVDQYQGQRQIADNASPNATNCEFKGARGVGNRVGFTQVGSTVNGGTLGWGMAQLHTTTLDQLVRFSDNGTRSALQYTSDQVTWNELTTVTFASGVNVDAVQAGATTLSAGPPPTITETPALYTFDGTDSMAQFDGAAVSAYAAGKKLLYGAYFDKRLWGVDPANLDTLFASTQADDATQKLSFTTNGTVSNPISLTIDTGSGVKIRGIKKFKNSLYVFTADSIYTVGTTSTANSYSLSLVTGAIGCVSHRSIVAVENDLLFAGDTGVFSVGEVGTYVSVRTTNKSVQIQPVFDALTGVQKAQLSACYFNYKYHLFYSLYGGKNDSCVCYDIRYQAWQDWRNYAANSAVAFRNGAGDLAMYFLQPSTGKVQKAYTGTTDDGSVITSTWYSKSFDEGLPELEKLFFDSTFVFGQLGGPVSVSVIFDDTVVTASATVTQTSPMGGFGRSPFGGMPFGKARNTVTVSQVVNQPQRLKAKGQKFAVQYMVSSTSSWRLDGVVQTLQAFSHFKFPSSNKLN